ncbi:MAG: CCA tRNA nucleotidyltransferase [Candidatus Micrarchaeota archaeon]|nr:CCA tRNA nucleotidyltransferase [Candidatus Micrarchaeota archaeon]
MTASLERLLDPIRAELRPTREDEARLEAVRKGVAARLKRVVPASVEIAMMGSVAKGTALRHNNEIDVFLLIPRTYSAQKMASSGMAWAKKAMTGCKTEVSYAQHPYLKARIDGVKVDIVPAFKMEEGQELGSAVDRSQLHTPWANARLDAKMRDDVRLLKQFMKALGVYGAQSRVEGFSGYLCELLVIHYGSFESVLRAGGAWRNPVLDPGKHHDIEKARAMFPDAAMVVIDPVDPARNVAAVVSHTSLSRFALGAREFLKKPSRTAFFREKEVHSAARLRAMIGARKTATVALFMPAPALVEDILWPQLRKTALALRSRLEKSDFRVFGHYFWSDGKRAVILFEVMEERLPAVVRRIGPPAWAGKDVEAFLSAHRSALNLHVEHERVVAVERREERTPKEALEAALRRSGRLGVPEPFARALKKRRWGTALDLLKDGQLREIASDYFSRQL